MLEVVDEGGVRPPTRPVTARMPTSVGESGLVVVVGTVVEVVDVVVVEVVDVVVVDVVDVVELVVVVSTSPHSRTGSAEATAPASPPTTPAGTQARWSWRTGERISVHSPSSVQSIPSASHASARAIS